MQLSKNKNYLHLRFVFRCWRMLKATTANFPSGKGKPNNSVSSQKSKLGEEQDQ